MDATFPFATIGVVYGGTSLSLGISFSAASAFAGGYMWTLILAFRRPTDTESRAFLPRDAVIGTG